MNPILQLLYGILVPFLGTVIGAMGVFFLRGSLAQGLQKAFFGLASGVMLAACIWSLILPAIEMEGGPLSAISGLICGMGVFLLLDQILNYRKKKSKSLSEAGKTLALAVTLHNFPEGLAVGVALAAAIHSPSPGAMTSALILASGIAIQNFPEGAIISLPLAGLGTKKGKAFLLGAASGAVEPIGAVLALLLTAFVIPILPFLLSFAAGAMLYVVIVELIPECTVGKGGATGCLFFSFGFSLMMLLDVMLG